MVGVSLLHAFNRATQCTRRAFSNRLDDDLRLRSVRVYLGFLFHSEHRGQVVGAKSSVCANASIVVNRYSLAHVTVPFIFAATPFFLSREADLGMCFVTERLVG